MDLLKLDDIAKTHEMTIFDTSILLPTGISRQMQTGYQKTLTWVMNNKPIGTYCGVVQEFGKIKGWSTEHISSLIENKVLPITEMHEPLLEHISSHAKSIGLNFNDTGAHLVALTIEKAKESKTAFITSNTKTISLLNRVYSAHLRGTHELPFSLKQINSYRLVQEQAKFVNSWQTGNGFN